MTPPPERACRTAKEAPTWPETVKARVTLGIGILIAARARTDREVTIASLLVTIILLVMMGAIAPLELMSPFARTLASFLSHTHATAALREVMILGKGIAAVGPQVLLLTGSGLAIALGGALLFRRSIDRSFESCEGARFPSCAYRRACSRKYRRQRVNSA